MKANQRFRVRKDLRCFVVYFENEGPLEMPELSAKIIEQLSVEKTREELISFVTEHFPDADAEAEVEEVIKTLDSMALLSH